MSTPTPDVLTLVGQALLIGFTGTEAAQAAPLVRRLRPAGLILLPRNIESVEQVARLTAGLQEVARETGMPRLLFAVDQEGGTVARLSSTAGFSDLPSAMSVGATGDPSLARALAATVARELSAVGINLDLAPVGDLALDPRNTVIGSRAYGSDPGAVATFATAVIGGLQDEGVLACAKHFPGHGSTEIDSHLNLPRLRSTRAELEARDLVPFRAAIAARCAAIMSAHVLSVLDPETPATVSRATLTSLLRDTLGFEGLILTDALEMQALRHAGIPPCEAGLRALRAGADLLVFEGDVDLIERTAAWIGRALEHGELDAEVLLKSEQRRSAARTRIGRGLGGPDLSVVGSAEHRGLVQQVAVRGFGVVDAAQHLPLRYAPIVLDSTAGREFASAVEWPVASPEQQDDRDHAVVGVVGDDGLDPAVRGALLDLEGSGVPRVLVVTAGWQAPSGLPADVTLLLAYDLPRSLWPLIADRLLGTSSPASGDAGSAPGAALYG